MIDMGKIEFVSTIEGLEKIDECRPKPAKHFIPKWFKNIPNIGSMPGIPEDTVKHCPSFTDYFSLGYILPMWADSILSYDDSKDCWNYRSTTIGHWEIHGNDQFLNYVDSYFNGVKGNFVFKAISPWRIITPPGWSVLQLPLFYHFNQEWSVLPGVIDTDIHHVINQQILYHGNGKEIRIAKGDPLVLYVPFKRKDTLDLDVRFQNKKDQKNFNQKDLNFKTVLFTKGTYRKMQRERDSE